MFVPREAFLLAPLREKILAYLYRMEADTVPQIDLTEPHVFEISGGYYRAVDEEGFLLDEGRFNLPSHVAGRGIDAIAYAVQQPEFYANLNLARDRGKYETGLISELNGTISVFDRTRDATPDEVLELPVDHSLYEFVGADIKV